MKVPARRSAATSVSAAAARLEGVARWEAGLDIIVLGTTAVRSVLAASQSLAVAC